MRKKFGLGFFAALLLLLFPLAALQAQDAAQPKEDDADVSLEVPENATVDELIKFAQEAPKQLSEKLKGQPTQKILVEISRIYSEVADKIIAADPPKDKFDTACMFKYQSFQYKNMAAPGEFDPNEVKKFLDEVKPKGASDQIVALMNNLYFNANSANLLRDPDLNKEKFEKFKNEFKEFLSKNMNNQSASMALRFLGTCDAVGKKIDAPELAQSTKKEFREILKEGGFEFMMLHDDFIKAEKKTLADFNAMIESYKRMIEKDPGTGRMASLILSQAEAVAEESGDPEFVANTGQKIIAILKDSGEPALESVAKSMEGEIRRAQLVGKEFSMEGVMLDGSKFDWSKYKGKTVLIDFWATWCGPCKAEVPFMKELYEKYHDKGFEIVGVNVWERDTMTAEDVLKYLEEEKVPWPHIDDRQSTDAGLQSLPEMYGISGIPTLFLVGKDGKVVSTTVRSYNKSLQEAVDKIFAE